MTSLASTMENDVKKRRKQNREEIMNQNRLQLCQKAQQCLESTVRILKKISYDQVFTYVDPKYLNIIAGFIHTDFDLKDILVQVQTLFDEENIVGHYKVIIGISNLLFKKWDSLTIEQFRSIFQTGLISPLSRLMLNEDHPFLQLRAAAIINKLSNTLRSSVFINKQSVPIECIKSLIKSDNINFMKEGMNILSFILRTLGPPIDDNQILICLQRCLVIPAYKIHTDIFIKIISSCSLEFQKDSKNKINCCFRILLVILRRQLIRNKNCYNMFDVLQWISKPSVFDQICLILSQKEHLEQYSDLHHFFKAFYSIDLKNKCFKSLWCSLMKKIGKTNKKILYDWDFLGKMEQEQKEIGKRTILYEVYLVLAQDIQTQQEANLLLTESILDSIRKTYEAISVQNGKSTTIIKQVLNEIVMAIFKASPFVDVSEILIKYSYIKHYISFGHSLLRPVFFKKLVNELNQMKTNQLQLQKYELIVEEIKSMELKNIINFLSLFKTASQAATFFKSLRQIKDEPIMVESNQNRVINLVSEQL